MEDWGYAAGWDTASVTPCTPNVNGGYDRAKTDYGRSGKVRDVYLVCVQMLCYPTPGVHVARVGLNDCVLWHVFCAAHLPRCVPVTVRAEA